MKRILIYIVLLYGMDVYSLQAQNMDTNTRRNDKIHLRWEKINNEYVATLLFPNGRELLVNQGRAAISPDSLKAAIYKLANIGDTVSEVTLYDGDGVAYQTFRVAALDNIDISNDGEIAMHGFYLKGGFTATSHLFLYDNSGKEYKVNREFGLYHKGGFLTKSNRYVFCAFQSSGIGRNVSIVLLVFRDDFSIEGEYINNEFPVFINKDFIVDEDLQSIILYSGKYTDQTTNTLTKERLFLDYQGKLQKTLSGWNE